MCSKWLEGSMTKKDCLKKDAELRLKRQQLRVEESGKRLEQECVEVEIIQNELAHIEAPDAE